MKELIGKTITAMYVNEDESILKFVIEGQGEMYYEAEGDCCSESWFADIIFTTYRTKFPLAVTGVEVLDVPEWLNDVMTKDGRCRQEFDQVYGYNIISADNAINIVYRNSSNGYYGGNCCLMDLEGRWSEYAKKKVDKAQWTQIAEDWRAE